MLLGQQEMHSSHSDHPRFDSLLSSPTSFQANLHNEEWESLHVCMPERDFPMYEQHGYLLLPTLVNVIGYFFVFFFTCTVHKIKYTSNISFVCIGHFVTDDQMRKQW